MTQNQRGLTLLEIMVSILIFSMISTLIFSILDRSFAFTAKGEARVLEIERHYGLIHLIRRQVQGAWFDQKLKAIQISSETENRLTLTTTASLMHEDSTLVMAFYTFDPTTATLYYTERKDFYNTDYKHEPPSLTEMIPLLTIEEPFSLQADPDSDFVILTYKGQEYIFHPFCTRQSQEFNLETRG